MWSDLLVWVIYFPVPIPACDDCPHPLGAFVGAQELPMRAEEQRRAPGLRHRDCENVSDQVIRPAECPGWECKQITHYNSSLGLMLNSPHPGHHYHDLVIIITIIITTDPGSLSSVIFSPASQNFQNKPDGLVLGWMLNGQLKLEKYFYCLSLRLSPPNIYDNLKN